MTKREDLPADQSALEKWKNLPQTEPSRSALPPAAGGLAASRVLVWGVLIIGLIMLVIVLIQAAGGQ